MDPGIFTLKNTQELYGKLEHDFKQMCKDTADDYACFNFFVTAHHLAEWHFTGDKKKANEFRKHNDVLRICADLANSAKHFASTRGYDSIAATNTTAVTSITHIDLKSSSTDSEGRPHGFFVNPGPNEVPKLGTSISVVDLAGQILALWKKELNL
jgi:hypothetical protein